MILISLTPQVISNESFQNNPPYIPSNPNPEDGEIDVDIEETLSWIGGDPDQNDTVTYDIYFGDINPPPLVISNQSETTYDPGTMNYNTIYYWQIIAWDNQSANSTGPLWQFTTIPLINQPPYEPSNPIPVNGAKNVDVNTDLKWSGGDPDGDPVRYDIFFGAISTPPLVASNYNGTTYDPGIMDFNTTYCWQIISYDIHNASSQGALWNFTTEVWTNRPPVRPNVDGIRGLLVPDIEYEYNIITTDPDSDDVFYFIDWGDGTFVDWFGPHESGTNTTKTHVWPRVTRMYEIRVKAKDIYGQESDWGTMNVIVISIKSSTRPVFGDFILRIIDRFPILEHMIKSMPLINRLINLR